MTEASANSPPGQLLAIRAMEVIPRPRRSVYPTNLAKAVLGRDKRVLGQLFGLQNFGVNLTTLEPGSQSALLHSHSQQDEFVYVLSGALTLSTGDHSMVLSEGMCAGFAANGPAHHLINHSAFPATYLEIGDRSEGDVITFPNDDLHSPAESPRRFIHKDGTAYE